MEMENNNDINDYLDRYHNGQVSEPEFQSRLQSDFELQEAYKLYKEDKALVRVIAKQEFNSIAAKALLEQPKKTESFFLSSYFLRVAAVFLLAICSYLAFQYSAQTRSPEQIFATHFQLPPPLEERSTDQNSKDWEKLMTAYQKKDFSKTIQIGEVLLNQQDFTHLEKGKLYVGISYLMIPDFAKAQETLGTVSPGSSFFQDAQWYSALAELKQNNLAAAKKAFEKIAQTKGHFKQKAAKAILLEL